MAGNGAIFVVFAISVAVGAGLLLALLIWLVMRFVRAKRDRIETVPVSRCARIVIALVSGFVVLLSAAAWILNIGWLRVLTLVVFPVLVIPEVYMAFLVILMQMSVPYLRQLGGHMICTYVLFFASFAFIPDESDAGDPYMFFMLIQGDAIPLIGFSITAAALIGCIVSMVLQYGRLKKLHAAAALAPTSAPAQTTE